MSSQVPEQLRSATYNLIAFIGSPGMMKAFLLWKVVKTTCNSQVGTVITVDITLCTLPALFPSGLNAWRSQGYNYSDVVAFTGTLQRILQLPGTAMDIRVA
ncbi:hypothetical protein HaLaN_08868, partial [Haematococcus lacustris]